MAALISASERAMLVRPAVSKEKWLTTQSLQILKTSFLMYPRRWRFVPGRILMLYLSSTGSTRGAHYTLAERETLMIVLLIGWSSNRLRFEPPE